MRILGIDPGLRRTGFGILDMQGQRPHYVASGTIVTGEGSLPERLGRLLVDIRAVAAEYRPDAAAIEIVFLNTNPQSTLLLGQARGAALCALVDSNLPVAEYTALQIKKAVTGTGRAAKAQIQSMMQRLLGLPGEPSPDAADALACALCHAHAAQMIGAMQSALGAGGLPQRSARLRRGRLMQLPAHRKAS